MKLLIENMQKNYGKKEVLKQMTYEFEEGNIYGLIGRNGAGKTTLFNCLMENITKDAGEVSLVTDKKRKLTFDDIGMVSASPTLPQFLTGYEFIKCYMEIHNSNELERIDEYFDMMKLEEEDRHCLMKNYSYGMKNKIQLMTCLISKPKVILLDEPLTSFDIVVAHDIKQILMEMKSNHIIIFSTHILQLAKDICDDIVLLSDGELKDASYNKEEQSFEEYLMKQLKAV